MTGEQKKLLLGIARSTVEAVVRNEPLPSCDDEDPILDEFRGVFVTLKSNEQLRGCIGRFTADSSLRDLIREMARASASEDPRFAADRITPGELVDVTVEISVLSPLEKTSDPLSIELGLHGIYIKKGFASGCFLPQVATETGRTKEEILSS